MRAINVLKTYEEEVLEGNLRPGLTGKKTITVTDKEAAPHVPVFSTPALLDLFEGASAQAVEGHLPPGMVTVGFEVNIRHLGPAPIGGQVSATAEVTAVKGTRVYFTLVAHHGDKKIGEGTHSRVIVPDRFGSQ